MKTLRNQVNLIARLGADVEVKTLQTGKKMARVNVATNEAYKNKDGEWIENTQWHTIVAWGTTADLMQQRLVKGSEVMLNGRLVNRSFETKEGDKRFVTEIEINDFVLLAAKKVK